MINRGWSKEATRIGSTHYTGVDPWDGPNRPRGWVGSVYGLVVHTTGSGLPSRAKEKGKDPVDLAIEYYTETHGTHYVIGWDGTIYQLANEGEQANGVGVTNKDTMKSQRDSCLKRNWEKDLPPSMVKRWKERWPGYSSPLDLFPSKYANSCYVHVECIPCVFHHNGKLVTESKPAGPGLRFTKAQHDAVARLAVDMAERNKWKDEWWASPHLVGHEDLTPISRHVRAGGWDPGLMRAKPWFDWAYLQNEIKNKVEVIRTEAPPVQDLQVVPPEEVDSASQTPEKLAFVKKLVYWLGRLLGRY